MPLQGGLQLSKKVLPKIKIKCRKREQFVISETKQASNIYLLTHARYVAATQLMWACGSTVCALIVASKYSFTDIERMDS